MYQTTLSTYAFETKRCEINISSGKNRQKLYGESLYLRDGQNFEIEIFNPHTKSILVKVKLNGNYISSSGLVIRPGQRVWLERYLDENKKFVFNTYEVENTQCSVDAIEENGKISVEIYYETSKDFLQTYLQDYWKNLTNNPPYKDYTYYTGDINRSSNSFYNSTVSLDSCSQEMKSGMFAEEPTKSLYERNGQIITGRIGKGDSSDQKFTYTNENFNSWVSETYRFKILPIETKLPEANEIRQYCVTCGCRKKKSNWKFCPDCGEKFE